MVDQGLTFDDLLLETSGSCALYPFPCPCLSGFDRFLVIFALSSTCCINRFTFSSTTVDQDAPSPSNSQTTPETQPPVIPNNVEEDNHDTEVAHMGNDLYF
ncbi:hypothetical protein Tco_0305676, partial [Tanacetum coccineum]